MAGFVGQGFDGRVVEVLRDAQVLELLHPFGFLPVALDVNSVGLFYGRGGARFGELPRAARQRFGLSPRQQGFYGRLVAFEVPAQRRVEQAQFETAGRQAQVGVIGAEHQAVFGARSEDPVGLVHAFRDQVVYHHAQVGLVAAQDKRGFAQGLKSGVDARDKPLARGFLVTGGPVHLTGHEKPRHGPRLQVVVQLGRVAIIVFDGVAGAHDLGFLQPGHGADDLLLRFLRQAGRQAVHVILFGVETFRLQEQVVSPVVRELYHLVLDGGAVARPGGIYLAAVEGRPVQAGLDGGGRGGIGAREPAGQQRVLDLRGEMGEGLRRGIRGLPFAFGQVQAARVQAHGRAGLEAPELEAQSGQAF